MGKQEFAATCAKCHGPAAQGFIGPKISDNPTTVDPALLKELLHNGLRTMPAVGRGWTDGQIAALVAYFKSKPFTGGTSGQ
ncbi:MAG: Cytochrome oxidase, cbb3-type, subunit, partial [Gaiellaceae bacterium]|nr:Cytochrome oxidase, cbb3-type, subunit [Gaiellaceae bacterium]